MAQLEAAMAEVVTEAETEAATVAGTEASMHSREAKEQGGSTCQGASLHARRLVKQK